MSMRTTDTLELAYRHGGARAAPWRCCCMAGKSVGQPGRGGGAAAAEFWTVAPSLRGFGDTRFLLAAMQSAFAFARNDLSAWRPRLQRSFGDPPPIPRRTQVPVTFADAKAANVAAALAWIGRERADSNLGFLSDLPLAEALAWLERLPGVARKVPASALSASTLAMPVLIADTHGLRVPKRLGFVGRDRELSPGERGDDGGHAGLVGRRCPRL